MASSSPLSTAAISTPSYHPDFFQHIYEELQSRGERDWEEIDAIEKEYTDLFVRAKLTDLQELCSMRNLFFARKMATSLIDEKGSLLEESLALFIKTLEKRRYPLGPDSARDARRQDHFLTVLTQLSNSVDLRQRLLRINRPSNPLIDQIIRDTLQLDGATSITDAHARRAALCAWLTFLRQNVGSCFATAPAILIHTEQPHQFLTDIDELLSTGELKRVYEGIECLVPISPTWGAGDLRKKFALFKEAKIHRAPGILAGLKAACIIDNTIDDQQIERARATIEEAIGADSYIVTDAERLFRKVILTYLDLSEKDIENYQLRAKPIVQNDLVVQVVKGGDKNSRCLQFFIKQELACKAFKSLTDNALLRTWEFSLASFAEIKANFTKWNLYASLGLNAQDRDGIGSCLSQILQSRLEELNSEVKKYQELYEQQYSQIKYLEARIRRATTEQEVKWLNIENQTKRNEFYTTETLRNKAERKAQRYANLFSDLIEKFLELFPRYFQEVYDADLHEVTVGPYDDSPAGFRLLFKYGRVSTSAWTYIFDHNQYVDALALFFSMIEPIISSSAEFEELQEDISQIITAIMIHVKTPLFIESAFYRIAAARGAVPIKNPLENLKLIEKKPWAYTSGGNMETLVGCYYRTTSHTKSARWVENELELAVFLLDVVKKMPWKISEEYLNDSKKSLLIHSPTHAFLLRPGLDLFKKGVLDKTFTYTWVRDQIFLPAKHFVTNISLDRQLVVHLLETIEDEIVPSPLKSIYRKLFSESPAYLSVPEFRNYFLQEIGRSSIPIEAEEIDSFLYRSLPIIRAEDVERRGREVIFKIEGLTQQEKEYTCKMLERCLSKELITKPATSKQLQNRVKAFVSLTKGALTNCNYHLEIAKACQKLGYAMPAPLLFADTNWVTDFFGFTVNPGTCEFELWRIEDTGCQGAPMSHWKSWLNGSKRSPEWGVFDNPNEYRA